MNKYAIVALACLSILVVGCKGFLEKAGIEEKLPEGTIIAFAAAPEGGAQEGDKHGLYTEFLLQEMQKSQPQQIEEVFKQVSRSIRETTKEQVPWYNTSLSSGNFCFGGCSKISSNAVKQLALVIGNQDYQQAPLQFTINDAQAIAEVLSKRGFEVTLKENTGLSEMNKAIQEFVKRLSVGHGVGLFYLSGFGVWIDGKDYLIPVDFNFADFSKNRRHNMVSVDHIVEQMQSANSKLNIIILDSCRYNPFSPGNSGK